VSHILITGASGLIGSKLTSFLEERHHQVSHLSRSAHDGRIKTFTWDVKRKQVDAGAFEGVDTIVHLAGAGIADKRWTEERKREILESRTHSTELLYETLRNRKHNVRTVVAASAIGYYGFTDNEKLYTESDPPGSDFLADVVKQWEAAIDKIQDLGIRVVKIRVGIVLSSTGGVLDAMAKPIKLYAGAPLGSGDQNLSWIHLDDLCAIFTRAIEDESMRGAYNGVSHNPVTNRDLTKAIARVLGKPLILPPVPAFALKLILGEMANLVLYGSKVSSEKIRKEGFQFRFTDLDEALRNLLGK
jgi:hypothetical protein